MQKGEWKGTSVDSEIVHRHRRSHLTDVTEHFLSETSGQTAHALRLTVQSEETCRFKYKCQVKQISEQIQVYTHIQVSRYCLGTLYINTNTHQAKVSQASA